MTYVVYAGLRSDELLKMVSASDDRDEAEELARSITRQVYIGGSRWVAFARPVRDILTAPRAMRPRTIGEG